MPKPQKKSSPLLLPMKSPLPYLEKSSFSLSVCVCVCVCVCVWQQHAQRKTVCPSLSVGSPELQPTDLK